MNKFLSLLIVPFFCLSMIGCTKHREPSTPAQPQATNNASSQTDDVGEQSEFKISGDKVEVNNHICASSKSPMEQEGLGRFTSEVVYQGSDPRFAKFKGKKLIFNQCCEGCVAKFPEQWAENPEVIMAFHGLH
ncbi:MAG TPA: hypothetical protein VJL87_05005 [Bdellovibrionota bacterium]|nr:hypothetical protein [Bdellovibrionota bacterium]